MFEFLRCSSYEGPVYSRGLCRQWFKDCDCYALIYSSKSRTSFDSVCGWQRDLQEMPVSKARSCPACAPSRLLPQSPPLLLGLIATRCDTEQLCEVSLEEGIELARELGCPLYRTSATLNWDAKAVLESLTKSFRDEMDRQHEAKRPVPKLR